MDIIKLEAMLPLTLGANIGTTGTALLASMVSDKPESVQIALCHLFFNIFGILIWFPIPFMRQYPLRAARQLGWLTRQYKLFPAVYILFMFVIFPGIFLGISQLFTTGGAYNVIGVFLLIVIALGVVRVIFFFIKQDGWTKVAEMLTSWQESSDFKKNLKSKIESLEEKVNLLENGGAVAVKTGSKI
jgi:sodium-dependent phosphate cotransporter